MGSVASGYLSIRTGMLLERTKTRRVALIVLKWIGGLFLLMAVGIGVSATIFICNTKSAFRKELEASRRKDWLAYDSIPKPVVRAVLAAEGADFFQCDKFSHLRVMWRLFFVRSFDNYGRPNCSITWQLARGIVIQYAEGRSLTRHLQVMVGIYDLHSVLSNRQIFEEYANRVYVGGGKYGLQDGSTLLFHKPLAELTKAEAAGLAAIIKAPDSYSPTRNFDRFLERQKIVLKRIDSAEISIGD